MKVNKNFDFFLCLVSEFCGIQSLNYCNLPYCSSCVSVPDIFDEELKILRTCSLNCNMCAVSRRKVVVELMYTIGAP